MDLEVKEKLSELGILKRKIKANHRDEDIIITVVFANLNGIKSMNLSDDFNVLKKHSFIYVSETMMTKNKFVSPEITNAKSRVVEHAIKQNRKGRPKRG